MATRAVAKAAPVSKVARRIAGRGLRRKAPGDRAVRAFFRCQPCEWRDIPTKLAMMDRLVEEAWGLVHGLAACGVKFAGSGREATLVIAGTAYAAWRASLQPSARRREPAHPALIVAGMADGLEFALRHKTGIPAMHADDYLSAVAESRDPLDRLTPIEALAELWPESYRDGRLCMSEPRCTQPADAAPSSWLQQLWEKRPNVLTAAPRELRKARAASRRRPARGHRATHREGA